MELGPFLVSAGTCLAIAVTAFLVGSRRASRGDDYQTPIYFEEGPPKPRNGPVEPVPAPVKETVPPTVPESEAGRVEPPRKTAREHLYDVAKGCIGRDMARVENELGCAEAVNAVYKLAFGRELGGGLSTAAMYQALKSHPDFIEVEAPLPGDIWISPTGTSRKNSKHGHVGVGGKTHVMSNNSITFKWDAAFEHEGWRAYYERKLGFPTFYFRRVGMAPGAV